MPRAANETQRFQVAGETEEASVDRIDRRHALNRSGLVAGRHAQPAIEKFRLVLTQLFSKNFAVFGNIAVFGIHFRRRLHEAAEVGNVQSIRTHRRGSFGKENPACAREFHLDVKLGNAGVK
jgi:hypothetical protein